MSKRAAMGTALSAVMLCALTGCGSGPERKGPCAELAKALQERPASDLNRLSSGANTESFQRSLGVGSRSQRGAANTHRSDDPIKTVDLIGGSGNKPEADLVFLAYADGSMQYVGCADVTAGRTTALPVDDVQPDKDAVFIIDPVWIGGRPYNKAAGLDFLPVAATEPPTGLFFGGRAGLLPPLQAPVVTDDGIDVQRMDAECGKTCLDFGILVSDVTVGDALELEAEIVHSDVSPRTTQEVTAVPLSPQPVKSARIAVTLSGSGTNLFLQQDWRAR